MGLPIVPLFTDCGGNAVGATIAVNVPIRYEPLPRKNGAPPLWDTLNLRFPVSATPCTSYTPSYLSRNPAAQLWWFPSSPPFYSAEVTSPATHTGHWPLFKEQLQTAPHTPSNQNKIQNSKGDAFASSPHEEDTYYSISKSTVLDTIQDVRGCVDAEHVASSILTLLEQQRLSGKNSQETSWEVSLQVLQLERETFLDPSDVATTSKDSRTGNRAWLQASNKAIGVASLLVRLIHVGVMRPDDLVVAVLLILKNRRRSGHLLLLRMLLVDGSVFKYSYNAVQSIRKEIDKELRGESGWLVEEVHSLANTLK